MNLRLRRLSLVLALALAILLTVSMAGLTLENSMLEVPLEPVAQAEPTATPTAQQGSRYSQYLRQKKAQAPEAVAPTSESVDTPTEAPALTPVTTPAPDDVSASVASAPVRASAVVDGNRLQQVIGNRLSSTIYGLSDDDSLFRSEDDGDNWELVTTSSEIKDFAMSPADPLHWIGFGSPSEYPR